jgi:hypothetical protein
MERLEVSGAVRPLKWPLGVNWLIASLFVKHSKMCFLETRHIISWFAW